MAYQKTGYQNWVEYDPTIDTIRYGTYTMNPTVLGLTRDTGVVGKAGGKAPQTMEDIYSLLGAKTQAFGNNPMAFLFGNQQTAPRFEGADAWKEQLAQQIFGLINPNQAKASKLYGGNPMSNPTATMMGVNRYATQANKGPQYDISVSQNPDGTFTYDRRQKIPDSQEFAQKVSDYANKMYEDSKAGPKRPQYSLLV